MSEHTVASHLQVSAAAYDAAIRTFVPFYDEMLATAVALLRALGRRGDAGGTLRVLDLGGGTGALSEAVLGGLPEATVTVLDVDPAMLAEARRRLAGYGDRVTYRETSFYDALPASDAVVASLSLHHVPDQERKTAVYRQIHACLAAGGPFLSLDATVSRDPRLAALTLAGWTEAMVRAGLGLDEAKGHLAAWAAEDFYQPLADELAMLAAAGFPHPECFWRRGPVTVLGGRKGDEA